MLDIFKIIQVLCAIFVIFLVCVQPSKQDGLGSMSGGNDENSNNDKMPLMTKITSYICIIFMILSFSVIYLENREIKQHNSEITLQK